MDIIDVWGKAILIADHVCSGVETYPNSHLVISVQNTEDQPTGLLLSIFDIASASEVGQCRVNHYGYCTMDVSLMSSRTYSIRQILEADRLTLLGSGQLKISYGDRRLNLTHQAQLTWSEGEIEFSLPYSIEVSEP